MKKIAASALALGALVLLPGLALAQDYPSPSIDPPYTFAPDSADAPIHTDHDKARAVREDNANGIFGQIEHYDMSHFRR
jgi:hypothetical protein